MAKKGRPLQLTKGGRRSTAFKTLAKTATREEWREALAHYPDNEDARVLLDLLDNSSFDVNSLGNLALKSGIPANKLAAYYINSKRLAGLVRQGKLLPDIMEEIARDALSTQAVCPKCDGEGIFRKKKCSKCNGEGMVRQKGDIERQKLVLQTHDLTGKKEASFQQALQINVGQQGAPLPADTIVEAERLLEDEPAKGSEEEK